MQVYTDLSGTEAPPCTLLAIRGLQFELGEPPGDLALAHLEQALIWMRGWLADQGVTTIAQAGAVHA